MRTVQRAVSVLNEVLLPALHRGRHSLQGALLEPAAEKWLDALFR